MTDSNGNMMYMPVAPAYGGGDGIFGGNGMNGLWGLIILLAVLGYGNGGGLFGGGNQGGGYAGGAIQRGFDQNAIMSGITNLQTGQCAGFAGVNQNLANGFAQAEISANARQMAEMNQYFQMQNAFQNCCCENRLATAQLNTTIAQEAAATRAAGTANTQAVLDKLCEMEKDDMRRDYEAQLRAMQTKLDAANRDIQTLQFAQSQTAQNALFQQGLNEEVDALYNRLNNCPVNTVPVYGRQPIFTCGNNGCGCGMAA